MKGLEYLYVFLIGGAICALVQLVIIRTKVTPARILVSLVIIGCILEASTAFKYMKEFAQSGVTVPLIGFGAALTNGAIEGARTGNFLNMIAGPLTATAVGIAVAVICGYLVALIFKPRTK